MHQTYFKPEKGSYALARNDVKAQRKTAERKAMDEARRRDRGCRWPRCECRGKLRVDVCHQVHRGMGGNPSGDRTKRQLLISLCLTMHGRWDTGRIGIEPQDTRLGFDGPADYYVEDDQGRLVLYASEKRIGESIMRDGR